MNRKQLGTKGELVAKDYLKDLGYNIICCNYRTKKGEIDIVASRDEILVFIEVKLRKSLKYGYPREAVNNNKVKIIKSVASEYLRYNNIDYKVRFDVVEIFLNSNNKYKINLIQNAFY